MARHGLWLSVVLSLAGCVDCGQVPGGECAAWARRQRARLILFGDLPFRRAQLLEKVKLLLRQLLQLLLIGPHAHLWNQT